MELIKSIARWVLRDELAEKAKALKNISESNDYWMNKATKLEEELKRERTTTSDTAERYLELLQKQKHQFLKDFVKDGVLPSLHNGFNWDDFVGKQIIERAKELSFTTGR